jgi:hypothetical protein
LPDNVGRRAAGVIRPHLQHAGEVDIEHDTAEIEHKGVDRGGFNGIGVGHVCSLLYGLLFHWSVLHVDDVMIVRMLRNSTQSLRAVRRRSSNLKMLFFIIDYLESYI